MKRGVGWLGECQFEKNCCFSSITNTPLCYYCITLGTKLLFTFSVTSSVLSTKVIYLLVPEVKNLSLKCKQIILSGWSVTYVLCHWEAQPAGNYHIFRSLCQFTKIYVTKFVPSPFWWIVNYSFNAMEHNFIRIFV